MKYKRAQGVVTHAKQLELGMLSSRDGVAAVPFQPASMFRCLMVFAHQSAQAINMLYRRIGATMLARQQSVGPNLFQKQLA